MQDRRLPITEELVHGLITDQFPQWAKLPIRRVSTEGWDNRTFRLGDELVVRLPSAERYAPQVDREQRWLPKLAGALPVAIPAPQGRGCPGRGYPFAWSIHRWIEGEPPTTAELRGSTALAQQLANFLNALQSIPADGGPAPGRDNFHRGGKLAVYDAEMQRALQQLPLSVRSPLHQLWQDALASVWLRPPVWVHGDFAPRNLLIRGGELAGVIDFGQLTVGDPACDLAISWTFLRGEARARFREMVKVDRPTWVRARGWAAWKAAILSSGVAAGPRADINAADATLQSLLRDP